MKPGKVPASTHRNKWDERKKRSGREVLEGLEVGSFFQSPPMFFTRDHHPLWLGDMYRGRSAFLICSGPSFKDVDHAALRRPNVLTMGVNNSVRTFRPHLWTCVDSPGHFLRSIWLDSTMTKFAPFAQARKRLFDSDRWEWMDMTVADCPNVVFYRRNRRFRAEQFFYEDTFNWGDHRKYGGGRSVMLVALRILFVLGIRRVYLLGVDFDMSSERTYHFEQGRAPGSVSGNRSTYGKMAHRFQELKEIAEEEGYRIYNCNPESRLEVFDFVPFKAALEEVSSEWGNIDVGNERTEGLYDGPKPEKPGKKEKQEDEKGGTGAPHDP